MITALSNEVNNEPIEALKDEPSGLSVVSPVNTM
jgi:hypothetical protein